MSEHNPYSDEQTLELINLTAGRLGLQEPAVVEKDLYVTKAIAVLMGVKNETFKLVFQGGAALAKAHNLIRRMSEDCDFRLAYRVPKQKKPKDAQRKLLRTYRKALLNALTDNGFLLNDEAVCVRNEGQFISIRAEYPSVYGVPSSLKPFIALELFLGQVKTSPVRREISSLIRQTLGDQIQHPVTAVTCMSILETAAEKWVALTRRVATAKDRDHYDDQSLVRHIYDLHMINKHQPLEISFGQLVTLIVDWDRKHFKAHSGLYHQAPIKAIKQSLAELQNDPKWENNWNVFMATMVYGEQPSYIEAMSTLQSLSNKALLALKKSPPERAVIESV